MPSQHLLPEDIVGGRTYRSAGDLVMAALASDLEGNIVGGVALDLKGACGQVVEVLVEELDEKKTW
jgi:hypothetical protein